MQRRGGGSPDVAFFTKDQTNPYFQSIRQGADSAARELDVSVVHFVPTRPDINDAMALGALEALEAANRRALVVGINGTKGAVDAVQAGRLLASGDCDGFRHGCGGVMAAVKHLQKEPLPADIEFAVEVIDRSNAASAGVLQTNRSCPKWDLAAR